MDIELKINRDKASLNQRQLQTIRRCMSVLEANDIHISVQWAEDKPIRLLKAV